MNLLEVFQRDLKRFGLSDIAGQYLAAAGKAVLIQNQCQGNQGTVISTLFRAPEAPKSLIVVLARTMGVRCGKACKDDPLEGKSASSLTHLVWLQKLLFVVQRWKGKRG